MTSGEYIVRVVVRTGLGLGPVIDFCTNDVDHIDYSTRELILLLYPLLCILCTVYINIMHVTLFTTMFQVENCWVDFDEI